MEFAYVVQPAFDQAFLARATKEELEVLEEHGTWLEGLYAGGRVVFAGRCYDGPFGLVVLDAGNQDEAWRLMQQDPSVRAGVQHADLYPFRTFLARERGPQDGPGQAAGPPGSEPA